MQIHSCFTSKTSIIIGTKKQMVCKWVEWSLDQNKKWSEVYQKKKVKLTRKKNVDCEEGGEQ